MNESNFLLTTDQNIQKQYINVNQTFTIPANFQYNEYVINHSLGYIPSVRVWYEPISGFWYPLSMVQMTNNTTASINILGNYMITTESIIINLANFSGSSANVNVLARIYLDN